MNKTQIVQLLDVLGVPTRLAQRRTGWYIAPCPLAPWRHDGGQDRSPSFGIKIADSGLSTFNCFSCGARGELVELVTQLRAYNVEEKHIDVDILKALKMVVAEEEAAEFDVPDFDESEAIEKATPTVTWSESFLKQFKPAYKFDAPMEYIQKRGVKSETVKDAGLLYDEKRKRVLFVLRDWSGRLVGVHSRTIIAGVKPPYLAYKWDPKHPKDPFSEDGYWNALPWLGEDTIDTEETVVVTEGPMDWLKIRQVYPNTLCSLSVGMSIEKIKRLRHIPEIVTFYDRGVGGDTARERIGKHLTDVIDVTPPEEFGDAGAMTSPAIKFFLEDYVSL